MILGSSVRLGVVLVDLAMPSQVGNNGEVSAAALDLA